MGEADNDKAAEQALSEQGKAALKFLDRDFNQGFPQVGHYDTQIFEIMKFSVTTYTAVLAAALGLHQFGIKEGFDFTITIACILATGLLFGFFLFALVVRNRVYFVQVARYINEQRALFFALRPLGFSNRSRMYRDPLRPPFFSPRSSQAWFMYLSAALNGALSFALLVLAAPPGLAWKAAVSGFVVVLQLILGICYLNYREDRSAESAAWGQPGRK